MTAGLLAALMPLLATPNFPMAVKDHLALDYFPPCALCHLNGITGLGTVNTPFGISMRARGLQAADVSSLNTALDALQGEGTDSDGDGTGDILELQAQTDPNVAGGDLALEPEYGCSASFPGSQPHRERAGPPAPWRGRGEGEGYLLIAMALGLAAFRRRAYPSGDARA